MTNRPASTRQPNTSYSWTIAYLVIAVGGYQVGHEIWNLGGPHGWIAGIGVLMIAFAALDYGLRRLVTVTHNIIRDNNHR